MLKLQQGDKMNKSNRSLKKENSYDQEVDAECQQFKERQCMFCQNINVLRCVCISVIRKHNDEDNFEVKLIENILNQDSESSIHKKFIGIIYSLDGQRLTEYYSKSQSILKMNQLLQFYKFRRFVPRFVPTIQSSITQNYYYQRLKLYYNQIKRQLNITVDPSSQQTQFMSSSSQMLSTATMKLTNNVEHCDDNVLKQLQKTIEMVEQITRPTLQQNCLTQSKALQDLICFLKSYPIIEGNGQFHHQQSPKLPQKTSKEIFKDFLQKNKSKINITNHNKNKIFITFFSKTNPNSKTTQQNPPKPLKIQNKPKIKVKLKQNTKNSQVAIKFQKIKQEILNQKYKEVKTKTHQPKKITPTKVKTSRNDQIDHNNCKHFNKKLMIVNGTQNKTSHFKAQVKSLSKLKPKRASSESKLKPTKIEPMPNKLMKNFVKGQNILLQNQSFVKKQIDHIENQQPQSRRKSLDLTKLKQFLKDNENKNLQQNDKNSDYSSHRYENLVFDTPRRLIKTTNVTPITSSRRQKDETNQIILQKTDNIVSMKKKKLQLLKRNMEKEKNQRK